MGGEINKMKKTIQDLKKELTLAKRKNKILEAKRMKAIKIENEARKIKAQLKKLNQSSFSRRLSRLKKPNITREQASKFAQQSKTNAIKTYKVGKKIWSGLGTVINHLDKMNNPVPVKKKIIVKGKNK